MRVRSLITGGAGFVGSHLAQELLRRDEEVYILDDLSTASIENIEHLKPNARFHYGWPAAELNDRGDLVVVYSRTGATV